MKFNWGTGIFLFYTTFAAVLISLVIKSTGYDNSLVEDNYYEKDLAYQSTYEKMQNSLALSEPLQIKYAQHKSEIELSFPSGTAVRGVVKLYRPDNQLLDKSYSVQTDREGKMLIPTQGIMSGVWKVKVEWEAEGVSFLDRKTFRIIP